MLEVDSELGNAATLGEALQRIASVLKAAGVAEPRREARWLVAAALDVSGEALLTKPDCALDDAGRARLTEWLSRRAGREPLWRISGAREFYGRSFALSPETLEPRPDSETVVAAVIDIVRRHYSAGYPARIIDVGTGSGCLLISILAELEQASGVGTDISPGALAVAAQNARALGVAERAEWRLTRSLEAIDETFDVLVSNPPYIPTTEIEHLEPEVRLHDPRAALDGGADGMDIYRAVAARACHVVPDGFLVLEVGAGQHQQVGQILKMALKLASTSDFTGIRDLSGHVRCVTIRTQQERHA